MTLEQGVQVGDTVTLEVPAAGVYVSVLRTVAAGLAARVDLTVDDVEDIRMAVDEACSLVLLQARPGSFLRCTLAVEADGLSVTVRADADAPVALATDTFAWTVLSALAHDVESAVTSDAVSVRLAKRAPADA